MRVLLVCDNPRLSMQVTTALLGDRDAEVVQARTPQRGLAMLDEGQAFDIVVGDADTAPTGGFFLAREIKARGQMGRDMPPVVLLLARRDDIFLSNWSQADAYVIKPVDPFDLAEVLHALVAGQGPPPLPRCGGDPTPSVLDIPGGESEADTEATAGTLPAGP